MTDTKMSKFIRGLVKTIFVLCYIAFMWASIHHVATFFENFEAGQGDLAGSYMLAGAFDITALVTTIGVMFFRKSMPRGIQVIVWAFIVAIAAYSFFINWEYSAHYQNAELILQSTGQTTPVYDTHGVLHYVPVMKQNTVLLYINPLLASGFTIFSLIYSVIAEFFGTKPPTVEELRVKKNYLEETASVLDDIKRLEGKHKGPGLIAVAKEKALEAKKAAAEVMGTEEKVTTEILTQQSQTVPQSDPDLSIESELLSAQKDTDPLNELLVQSGQENEYNPFTEDDYTVDRFVDISVNTPVNFERTESELSVDTEPSQIVHTERTPKPRITVNLSERNRNTDDLSPVNKKVRSTKTTSAAATSGDAAKRVHRVLKRNPKIGVAELAEKANVSRSYASQIRSQYQPPVSA